MNKFALLTFTGLLSFNAAAETWNFATFEAHPYMCQACEEDGIGIKIVRDVLAANGVTAEFAFMPYARSLVEATNPKYVGYLIEWPSDMPADDYVASNILFTEEILLFSHQSNNAPWASLSDLKGKSFGTVVGYGYGEEFEALRASGDIVIEEVNEPAQNFKKLRAKRMDYVVSYYNQFKSIVTENNMDPNDFYIHETPIARFPNIIAVNKNHPQFEEVLDNINTWFEGVSFQVE